MPGLFVGGVDLAGLGILDDMGLELGDLGHAPFQLLDAPRNLIKPHPCAVGQGRKLVIVGQAVVDQKVQGFGGLLQIENLCPPLIAFPFSGLHLGLDVNEQPARSAGGEAGLFCYPRLPA